MSKRFVWGLFVALLFLSKNLEAQTATPSNKLQWKQLAQTVAVASGAVYTVYVDGAALPAPLSGVSCVLTGSDSICTAPFPALTPGTHRLALTQKIDTAESDQSVSISFSFVIVVTPTEITIIKGA